jgi:hypothetical protein
MANGAQGARSATHITRCLRTRSEGQDGEPQTGPDGGLDSPPASVRRADEPIALVSGWLWLWQYLAALPCRAANVLSRCCPRGKNEGGGGKPHPCRFER